MGGVLEVLGLVDTVRLGVVRFGSDLGRGDNPNEFYSSVRSSDTRHPGNMLMVLTLPQEYLPLASSTVGVSAGFWLPYLIVRFHHNLGSLPQRLEISIGAFVEG